MIHGFNNIKILGGKQLGQAISLMLDLRNSQTAQHFIPTHFITSCTGHAGIKKRQRIHNTIHSISKPDQ